MAGPGTPVDPGSGNPPPPSATGTTQPGGSGSLAAIGDHCTSDSDCESHQCGVGREGQLVCVGGSTPSSSLFGGCSASPSSDRTKTALILIVAIALLLSRGLRRRV
jgi:MYXO-CTERM domain-containing protein